MTLSELVKGYRAEHDLSQRQFAIICNLSNGYISMLESGINPRTGRAITPTLPQLKRLADGMGISLDSLFRSVDDMPVELALLSDENDVYDDMDVPTGFRPLPRTVKRPLVGRIACGEPITAEENIEDYVDVPSGSNCDFCLLCEGNSMVDANISDGDIVYIRAGADVHNGEIAAVRIGDEATLKRIYLDKEKQSLTLVPANAQYAPKTYSGTELAEIHIEGKVVGFTHWFE